MSNLIRKEVKSLQSKLVKYQKKIEELQNNCTHEIVTGEYKASTGNWCPQDDSYWISAKCLDCGKYIHADSDTELYKKLSKSGMISSQYDSKEKYLKQCMIRLEIESRRLSDNKD